MSNNLTIILVFCSILLYGILALYSCAQEPFVQGKRIYEVNCGNCHMSDGHGLGDMYPDITKSDYFTSKKTDLICLIRHGKKGSVMESVIMPANKELTEVGINNLVNYLNYTWGDGSISKLDDVKTALANCQKD